jgi:hypothetical protein
VCSGRSQEWSDETGDSPATSNRSRPVSPAPLRLSPGPWRPHPNR